MRRGRLTADLGRFGRIDLASGQRRDPQEPAAAGLLRRPEPAPDRPLTGTFRLAGTRAEVTGPA
jgi:hypothetical protein